MEETQYPKQVVALPEIDIKITMSCNISCPFLQAKEAEDWGLDDPMGQGYEAFIEAIAYIT